VISGLYATFIMGLITAVFGGRPGMISGAAGALAVNMGPLVKDYSIEHLYMSLIICGAIQIFCGFLHLGKLVRLIGEPVMIGFVNGLAIVIGYAQVPSFRQACDEKLESACEAYISVVNTTLLTYANHTHTHYHGYSDPSHSHSRRLLSGVAAAPSGCCPWIEGTDLYWMIAMVLIVMIVMKLMPMIPKVGGLIPSALVGICICTLINHWLDTKTVGAVSKVSGDFPMPHSPTTHAWTTDDGTTRSCSKPDGNGGFIDDRCPQWNIETIGTVLPSAVVFAIIGLIESMMTLQLIDDLTETTGSRKFECYAQGVGNLVCGWFKAMGGCAMIGQSQININSGARTRASAIIAALGLLAIIMGAHSFVQLIPVASLVGVMVMVVVATFDWNTFWLVWKIPYQETLIILVVTVITCVQDLAVAVIVGVILSSLFYTWDQGYLVQVDRREGMDRKNRATVQYKITGQLFFGSVRSWMDQLTVKEDPEVVEVDLTGADILDYSSLMALTIAIGRWEGSPNATAPTDLVVDAENRVGKLVESLEAEEGRIYRDVVLVGPFTPTTKAFLEQSGDCTSSWRIKCDVLPNVREIVEDSKSVLTVAQEKAIDMPIQPPAPVVDDSICGLDSNNNRICI